MEIYKKKRYLRIVCLMMMTLVLSSCGEPDFDGSRLSNDHKFYMQYSAFDTTDSHFLQLQEGDVIAAEIVSDAGKVSATIQKEEDPPVYEEKDIPTSTFQVEIVESGTYKITVTGEKAEGSISFKVVMPNPKDKI